MSGSTSLLDLLASSQSSKETVANTLLNAMSQGALFGKRDSTTTGLTWGYFGGNMLVGGVVTAIANGTLALSNNTTNYIEVNTSGTISSNTSSFTVGATALYSVVTSGGQITTWVDYRLSGTGGGGSTGVWRNVTDSTTLVLADAYGGVSVNKATAATVTIPPASSVSFTGFSSVAVFQRGAGQVQILPGSGVSILNSNAGSPEFHATRTLNSLIVLLNLTTDIWIVTGDVF